MDANKETLINDILNRSADQVIDKEILSKKLHSDEKLRIKLGIDPTSPNIHLGRTIPLLRLKRFQELGHQIVFIIGDFTAVIGDTSDKTSERPMLSREAVEQNKQSYIDQVKKLIDIDKAEIHYNTEWLGKLTYGEICEQANVFSVNEFIDRSNIKDRLDKGDHVSLREVLYPMMQGYDSVAIKADVELGGTDQWFNLLAGRKMQKHYQMEQQNIITNPLIEGLDGRKMSSSWGNTINLNDEPENMYGKVMSMSDELIGKYFEHLTLLPMTDVNEIKSALAKPETNPMEFKLKLAFEITKMYWGEAGAKKGQEHFDKTIRNKELPTEMPTLKIHASENITIVDVLVQAQLAPSKSEARRLIEQKGVEINNVKVESTDTQVKSGDIIKKGNRSFVRID